MSHRAFGTGEPPARLLTRPKTLAQHMYDLVGTPLRLACLPDEMSERLGLSSLRCERMAAVLPELTGRVLDVGAGDNLLVRLYRHRSTGNSVTSHAQSSVGVDVHDWGGGCIVVESATELPFADAEFDTISFVACLNHIPQRLEALREARRVLRPGGRLVATMIGPIVGAVGHAIWWYSEDKHRTVQSGERDGLSKKEMGALLRLAGFSVVKKASCVYGLNTIYVAHPC